MDERTFTPYARNTTCRSLAIAKIFVKIFMTVPKWIDSCTASRSSIGKTWDENEDDNEGTTHSSLLIVYARECRLLEAIFVESVKP